ncbi:unnamed protein product [Parnassius mnemosyne]|uniref:MADF domain-containing protein n=1 Tax=Parnassius mnemosyne TaxID=213953 RepID=A0AAV1KP76_9NEOP
MSVSWTNEQELMLIECLHAEPILWDAKHKYHKNKMRVHDAWMRIKEIMNIEVTDLKKKKENLMSSYRTYRKKVKDSVNKSGASSDEIYKPIWFAFDAIDAFLRESDHCKKTTNTVSMFYLQFIIDVNM